jgi:hypothetical protein
MSAEEDVHFRERPETPVDGQQGCDRLAFSPVGRLKERTDSFHMKFIRETIAQPGPRAS